MRMPIFYGLDLLKAIAVIEIRDVVRGTRYSHTEVPIDYNVGEGGEATGLKTGYVTRTVRDDGARRAAV